MTKRLVKIHPFQKHKRILPVNSNASTIQLNRQPRNSVELSFARGAIGKSVPFFASFFRTNERKKKIKTNPPQAIIYSNEKTFSHPINQPSRSQANYTPHPLANNNLGSLPGKTPLQKPRIPGEHSRQAGAPQTAACPFQHYTTGNQMSF